MLRLPWYIRACLIISWHSKRDQIFHEIKSLNYWLALTGALFTYWYSLYWKLAKIHTPYTIHHQIHYEYWLLFFSPQKCTVFVLFIFLGGKGGGAKKTLSFISFPHIHRHICRNRQNCFRLLHHDVIYHRIQGHAQQTARDPLFYAIIIMHGLEQVDVGNRSTVEYVEL